MWTSKLLTTCPFVSGSMMTGGAGAARRRRPSSDSAWGGGMGRGPRARSLLRMASPLLWRVAVGTAGDCGEQTGSPSAQLQILGREPRFPGGGAQLADQHDVLRLFDHVEFKPGRLPVGVAGHARGALAAADTQPRAGVRAG